MSMLAHDAIVDAIIDALGTAPALADGEIHDLEAFETMPEGVDAALVVGMLNSEPGLRRYGKVDWTTTVRVSCLSRYNRPTLGNRRSGELAGEVFARLMAVQTLGGLAETIDPPRLNSETQLLGSRTAVLHCDFPVRHKTDSLAITAP